MEIKIAIGGVGLAVPQTRIGLNLQTGAIIDFRKPGQTSPFRWVLGNRMSFGSGSGTLVTSNVITEWFPVNVSRNPWLHRKVRLTGQRADLEVAGSFINSGEVDIKLVVFDSYGAPCTLIEKAFIDTVGGGWQLGSTRVRGVLQRWRSSEEPFEDKESLRVESQTASL